MQVSKRFSSLMSCEPGERGARNGHGNWDRSLMRQPRPRPYVRGRSGDCRWAASRRRVTYDGPRVGGRARPNACDPISRAQSKRYMNRASKSDV